MTQVEKSLQKLSELINTTKPQSREDIVDICTTVFPQFVNDEKFDLLVDNIISKYGIEIVSPAVAKISEFLRTIDGRYLRRYNESADFDLFAEALYVEYRKTGKLSHARIVRMGANMGFVISKPISRHICTIITKFDNEQ